MFNYDALNSSLRSILRQEFPDMKYSEAKYLANKLGEAAVKWMPKHGDFWLNEDDGFLYVNKGWGRVTAESPEGPESNALQALDNLYNDNNKGMKRLAAE